MSTKFFKVRTVIREGEHIVNTSCDLFVFARHISFINVDDEKKYAVMGLVNDEELIYLRKERAMEILDILDYEACNE